MPFHPYYHGDEGGAVRAQLGHAAVEGVFVDCARDACDRAAVGALPEGPVRPTCDDSWRLGAPGCDPEVRLTGQRFTRMLSHARTDADPGARFLRQILREAAESSSEALTL